MARAASRRTIPLTLLSIAAAAASLRASVDPGAAVAEDAALLMRYARHLADGLGYAWNPGGPPIDGATDWLATTLLGGLYAAGVSLEAGPRLLGGIAHVLTVGIVVVTLDVAVRAPRLVTLATGAVLIAGPAHVYIQLGFLTTLFALWMAAGWSAIVFAASARRGPWPWLFAGSMLVATLTRPEGVAVTAIMVAAAAFVLDAAALRRTITALALLFAPLCAAFVLWRWQYFGRLLPLPFLKKGGGALHWDGLMVAWTGGWWLLGWCLLPFAIGLARARSRGWTLALIVLAGGYLTMWVLLSSEMNLVWRFQYPIVPSILCCWWMMCADLRIDRRVVAAAVALGTVAVIAVQVHRFQAQGTRSGAMDAALRLARYRDVESRLVTTEAGLIPLYSGWNSVDAWGLNDPRVVADGIITEAYLDEIDPRVIIFHANYVPGMPRPEPVMPWDRMAAVLHRYADCHGFRLAAAFTPDGTQAHYYFVKAAWPRAAALAEELRTVRYEWPVSDTIAIDVSDRERSPVCGP